MGFVNRPFPRSLMTGFLLAAVVLFGLNDRGIPAQDQKPPAPDTNPFPGRFPAPDLDGGTEWLNTSAPISLRELRGKIVLLDFWTYCCINCIHVLPDLKYLEKKYADQLVVIGVHSAKFDNEKESENIRQAIIRYEIEHPVVNDSNMTIARKYFFNSWPTLVLIDPEGNFVGRQPGEGTRDLFDEVIGKMVEYHRAKGTLDEKPVKFNLEREKRPDTPLKYPGKILADAESRRLFIADSNHNRIVVADFDGRLIDVIGSGRIGAQDGTFADASFDHPQGMALVGNTLYVADTENHLLRTVDLVGKTVSTLAGTGTQARQRLPGGKLREIALNSPWDVQALNNTLYVAMAGPHQLWKHELGSGTIELFAGTGREDILDGPLDACALAQPSGITTDGQTLFIVDSEGSAVRSVTLGKSGTVTTIVGPHDLPQGRSLFEFGDIDGVGDEVRLQHPIGLTYHNGRLFIADTYNDKIKLIDPKSRESVTWLGTGERGNGLDPVQLSEPAGVSAAAGELFIADTNNSRILAVNLETRQAREIVIQGLTPPATTTESDTVDVVMNSTKVPAVTLAAGKPLSVRVEFKLPEGYKLNQLASVGWRIATDSPLVDPAVVGKRKQVKAGETSASIDVPLSGQEGTGTLVLSVNYQYCRDGVGGVCKLGTRQWEIPITVAANGTNVLELQEVAETAMD